MTKKIRPRKATASGQPNCWVVSARYIRTSPFWSAFRPPRPALSGSGVDQVRDFVVLHGLAVPGQLEAAHYESGGLEPLEMHVEKGPAHADLPRQVAHVVPPADQRRDDAQSDRVGQRRQHLDQGVASRSSARHLTPTCVRKSLHDVL